MTIGAPYGTWKSPITTDSLVEEYVRLAFPSIEGDDLYWLEQRPAEAGRYVLVRRGLDGETVDAIPEGFSARTLVHEYGGLGHAVAGSTLYFANLADQRIYRVDGGGEPEAITPEPPSARAWRYADFSVMPDGRHLVAVRERHEEGEVVNDIVAVATDGSRPPVELAGGHDFVSSPVVSPDGRRLAWVGWDHPRMPWDGTLLYEAELVVDDGEVKLVGARVVAGGENESVVEPRYSPEGQLHYVSDRTDWWNIYADDGAGGSPVAPAAAEFSLPAWNLGLHSYDFLPDGRIVARWRVSGTDHVGTIAGGELHEAETHYATVLMLDVAGDRVVFVGGAGDRPLEIAETDPSFDSIAVVRRSLPERGDEGFISLPKAIEYATEGGLTAHAFYYPPRNDDYEAPEGELPPLVVWSHGGPTAATMATLDYGLQYWTSRGFAVVDVNYGGSTGYGRSYRERLKGAWGVVDLDDCVNAALVLAERGLVDRSRLLIRGGSAGGYTTLCAVTFRDVFAAGASYFGVADVGALARDTHKFESRYMDGLIGPWPEAQALYEERSPIFHVDLMRTPLLLLQGLEDEVVPPAQAEMMLDALREKGVPVAYLPFEGEQHGFRQAANMKRAAEAELYFYGKVLGFTPADDLEPVEIENAGALPGGGAED